MKFENVIVGALETNCYLVYCEETSECAVVDPGAEPEKIFLAIADSGLKPVVLINTHGHIDHIGANKDIIDKFGIPLFLHAGDGPLLNSALQSEIGLFLAAKESPFPDRYLKDGEEVTIGKGMLRVIHTPGHSPGSISLLGDGFLLSGDSLFCGGVGRTDLPGGSWRELASSIRNKILTLPGDLLILPGHGPHTTVDEEISSNPFIV